MWSNIRKCLGGYPERLKVARVLVENGLSVKNGKIYLNEIERESQDNNIHLFQKKLDILFKFQYLYYKYSRNFIYVGIRVSFEIPKGDNE